MSPVKTLAGGAKQYLDDLVQLNANTSAEMERGLRDGYLDPEGAIAVAQRLNITPPRIKRSFKKFFTMVEVYAITVDAYDEEQALAEAARLHEQNVTIGEVYYGQRTRFNEGNGPIRRVFSPVVAERPQSANVMAMELHPWEVERAQRLAEGVSSTTIRRDLERRMNNTTFIR